jgi:hypothetical protein
VNVLTFGNVDETAAALDALTYPLPLFNRGSSAPDFSTRYSENRETQRAIDKSDEENRYWHRNAGQVLAGAAFAPRAAVPWILSKIAARRAVRRVAPTTRGKLSDLSKLSLASAVDSLLIESLSRFGKGQDGFVNRISEMPRGAFEGFIAGALTPFAFFKAAQGAKTVLTPTAAAQLRQYANDRVMDALAKGGPWSTTKVRSLVSLENAIDRKRGPALIEKLRPRQQHEQQLEHLKHIAQAAGYVQPFSDLLRDLLTQQRK